MTENWSIAPGAAGGSEAAFAAPGGASRSIPGLLGEGGREIPGARHPKSRPTSPEGWGRRLDAVARRGPRSALPRGRKLPRKSAPGLLCRSSESESVRVQRPTMKGSASSGSHIPRRRSDARRLRQMPADSRLRRACDKSTPACATLPGLPLPTRRTATLTSEPAGSRRLRPGWFGC